MFSIGAKYDRLITINFWYFKVFTQNRRIENDFRKMQDDRLVANLLLNADCVEFWESANIWRWCAVKSIDVKNIDFQIKKT